MQMIFKKLVGHLQFNYTNYFIFLLLDKIFNVIFSLYIVKLLTESEYGIYGFTISFSSFASNILLLGIATPIVVIIGKNPNLKENFEEILVKLISVSFILYVVFAVIIILKLDWVSQIFYNDIKNSFFLFVLLTMVFSDIIISYRTIHFRLFDRFVDNARFILQLNLIKILVFVAILFVTENFFYAFYASSFCTLIFVVFSYDFFWKLYRKFIWKTGSENFRMARPILIEGLPFLVIYILMNFSLYLINFLIVDKLSLESYATYNFNFTCAFLPMSFVSYVVFYSFQNYVTDASESKFPRQVFSDLSLGLLGIVIYYVFFWLAYDYILDFVGKGAYSNFTLFTLIYISMVMTAVSNFLYFPLYKDRRYSRVIFVTGLSVLVNIAYLFLNEEFQITTPSIGLILSLLVIILLFLISINERKVSIHSTSK
jgi:O-antigen/teichoic acid export membrane protein